MEENLEVIAREYLDDKKYFDGQLIKLTTRLDAIKNRMESILFQWKNIESVSVDQELEFGKLIQSSTSILIELTEIEAQRVDLLLPLIASTGEDADVDREKAIDIALKLREAGRYDLREGITLRENAIDKYEEVMTMLYELLQRKRSPSAEIPLN